MRYHKLLLLLIVLAISIVSCKKDASNKTNAFKEALISNNIEAVKAAIETRVNRLPSKKYSEQNLNNLGASLVKEYSISAEVLCFSCIKTLPEESEIKLSFLSEGSVVQRIIDITYTEDNTIRFVNMHE